MLGRLYIENTGYETVAEILVDKKLSISKRMVECIDVSFNNDIDSIEAFVIESPENPATEFIFTIYRENWNEILESCMSYYLEIEDYESCSYVKSLTDRINTDFTGHPDVD